MSGSYFNGRLLGGSVVPPVPTGTGFRHVTGGVEDATAQIPPVFLPLCNLEATSSAVKVVLGSTPFVAAQHNPAAGRVVTLQGFAVAGGASAWELDVINQSTGLTVLVGGPVVVTSHTGAPFTLPLVPLGADAWLELTVLRTTLVLGEDVQVSAQLVVSH